MTSQFKLRITAVTVVALACFAQNGASDEPQSCRAAWKDFRKVNGVVTVDQPGGVVIVGGTVDGPSPGGGTAECRLDVPAEMIGRIQMTIHTNGGWDKFAGKGAHSLRPGGTIQIHVNKVLVHTIVCDQRGEDGQYWPRSTPKGSPEYKAAAIDFGKNKIRGRNLPLTITASPGTAIDIHVVELTASPGPTDTRPIPRVDPDQIGPPAAPRKTPATSDVFDQIDRLHRQSPMLSNAHADGDLS